VDGIEDMRWSVLKRTALRGTCAEADGHAFDCIEADGHALNCIDADTRWTVLKGSA
jgi:hypothetical protein